MGVSRLVRLRGEGHTRLDASDICVAAATQHVSRKESNWSQSSQRINSQHLLVRRFWKTLLQAIMPAAACGLGVAR